MSIEQKISVPLATLSESIEEGLELAFRRMRPSDNFDEYLLELRSDGTDIEVLNDICEQALLHEEPLSADDRTKIVAAHRAFNSVLRLDGRGALLRMAELRRKIEREMSDELSASEGESDTADANKAAVASAGLPGTPQVDALPLEQLSSDRISSLLLTGVIDGFFASEGSTDPRIWTAEIGYTRENRFAHWKDWCERAMASERTDFSSLPEFKQEAIRFTCEVLNSIDYVARQFERGFEE